MDPELRRQMNRLHADIKGLSEKVVSLEVEVSKLHTMRNEVDTLQRIIHGNSSSPGMKAEIAFVKQEREQNSRDRQRQWLLIVLVTAAVAAAWFERFIS